MSTPRLVLPSAMPWTEESTCVTNLPRSHRHTRARFLLLLLWFCCIAVACGAATSADKVKKHPLAITEPSEGARPPRSAAASGRLVLSAPATRLLLLGSLGWAGAAPKHHAASSDGGTAIELLSEVVTWSVLVWFGRQRVMKKLGLRRPRFFF